MRLAQQLIDGHRMLICAPTGASSSAPPAAAAALAVGLMRSDAATCKVGYTLEAALDAIQTLITVAADAAQRA